MPIYKSVIKILIKSRIIYLPGLTSFFNSCSISSPFCSFSEDDAPSSQNWALLPVSLIMIFFDHNSSLVWSVLIVFSATKKKKSRYHTIFVSDLPHLASLVTQMVKSLPAKRETWVQSLGQEDPLEKETATHSSILAREIPWTEEPGRLQSLGSQRVGHNWATNTYLT